MNESSIRLFADDCVLYRAIKNNTYTDLLQEHSETLQAWKNDWNFIPKNDKSYTLPTRVNIYGIVDVLIYQSRKMIAI